MNDFLMDWSEVKWQQLPKKAKMDPRGHFKLFNIWIWRPWNFIGKIWIQRPSILLTLLCFKQKYLDLGLSVGRAVCRSVCWSSKQDLLWTSLVFKTRFSFNARDGHQPSTQRNKQSNQNIGMKYLCLQNKICYQWEGYPP